MFRRLAACLAVLTALSAPDAFAQPAQTGTIAGVIQDASKTTDARTREEIQCLFIEQYAVGFERK